MERKDTATHEDRLLRMFFEPSRWEYAISKGVGKDIRRASLIQLCTPARRAEMARAIVRGEYEIFPPHTAQIPKDTPGEYRTVYVNEAVDRIFLSIVNDMLFDLCPEMVHPRCKSYLRGTGCGKVVRHIAGVMAQGAAAPGQDGVLGWKSDLSKYFDSVPVEYIDRAFDMVEARHGHSAVIDVVRKYYHSDLYFETDADRQTVVCERYQSLKQGCSVASWLADVILYHIDDELSRLDGYYVRYSDDMLFIGPDSGKAMAILEHRLGEMGMRLNPRKVESLDAGRWFKFLGFSIRGGQVSLSGTRIKTFQREIEQRTVKYAEGIRRRGRRVDAAAIVRKVHRYLYVGDGEHSWSTQVLPVVNVEQDISRLNTFVMDAIRAAVTGRDRIGGLGYSRTGSGGCILRGTGRNVTSNRSLMPGTIPGYLSLGVMRNLMHTSVEAYRTAARTAEGI